MSVLIYNGISLELVRTHSYSRQAIYDESGTDYLYTRHALDITAVYSPKATSYSEGDPPTATTSDLAPTTDRAIRHQLMVPRKRLSYVVGTIPVLDVPPEGQAVDALNGPKPLSCDVRQVHGNKTFIVSYKIECHVIECPSDSIDPLISDRWTMTHRVNEQQLTTQVTRGVAVFRMDRLNLDIGADLFRYRVLPPCPPGFKRVSIDVTLNPLGNALVYQVVDQEQMYSLGSFENPARRDVLKFEAVQSQSTLPIGESGLPGPNVVETLDVRAIGNPDSSRQALIGFAVRLAVERLALKAGPIDADTDGLLRRVMVSEHLHDRIIDLRAEVQLPVTRAGVVGLGGLRTEFIGADIINSLVNDGQSPQMPNDLNSRGTFTGRLFAQKLQEVCASVEVPTAKDNPGAVAPGSGATPPAPPTVNAGVSDDLIGVITRFGEDAVGAAHITAYSIDTTYDTDRGVLACAVAAPAPVGGGGVGTRVKAEVMTVAQPITIKTVNWEAARVGAPPMVPTPFSGDPNWTLLRDRVTPSAPGLAPDGQTPVYRLAGTYTYIGSEYLGAGDDLPQAVVPWTDFAFRDTTFPAENFVHGLIDYGPAGGGNGGGLET